MRTIPKPGPDEYPPYAEMYMKWMPDDGALLRHLEDNWRQAGELIRSLPDELLDFRYAPGKWSVRETLVHIVDDERIYAYRALCFARNETAPLPGFGQDDYARYSGAGGRTLESILAEYEAVRRATITLFEGLPEEALTRRGTADGKQVTVRALGYHIAGHEQHHLNLIRTRYLPAAAGMLP